jgi:Zn-dependent protease/predicted transcriptional regulator
MNINFYFFPTKRCVAACLARSLQSPKELFLGGYMQMLRTGYLTLVTIRGVPLRLHFSLIFIMAYVVVIASINFPFIVQRANVDPTVLSWDPIVWGILFAVGLFISIAIHEFGHVLIAQFYDVNVKSVTLMMLGGVSDIERMPDRPYAEFNLAIIGPMVSLGLFAALYLVQNQANSVDIYFYAYWLGGANLVLGIFNLLPAFPLDGGRALRSFLSERRGPTKATNTSVKISKGFAWFLGIVGLVQFNFILMLIAFFIYFTAKTELFLQNSKKLLEGVNVEEATVISDPIDSNSTLKAVAERMTNDRQSILAVRFSPGSASIISLQDLKRVDQNQWEKMKVNDVAQVGTKTVQADEDLSKVLPDILQDPHQALPVMKNGEFFGIVEYSKIAPILEIKSLADQEIRKT